MFSSVAIFCPPPPIGKCPQCRATEVHYAVFSKKPIYWVMKMLYLSKVTLENILCKLQWSMSRYSYHMAVLQKNILGSHLHLTCLQLRILISERLHLIAPFPHSEALDCFINNGSKCLYLAYGGHLHVDPVNGSLNRLWSLGSILFLVPNTSHLLEIAATLITWEMLKSMFSIYRQGVGNYPFYVFRSLWALRTHGGS